MNKLNGFIATLASVVLALGGSVTAVNAQSSDEVKEEVIVTGSRVSGVEDLPSPVDVFTIEDLELTPRSSISEFFHSSTIAPGSAVFGNVGGNGMSPSRTISLRGLGSRATLIVLNGRRNVNNSGPTQAGTVAVDVDSLLPSIMIERMEVLKDGGSALYGTDAVAGVINFITRSDFEGIEASVDYLRTETGGQDDMQFNAIFGGGNDRMHLVTAIEYTDRDNFDVRAHDEVKAFGTVNGFFSSYGMPATYRAGKSWLRDPLCGDASLGEGTVSGIVGPPFCRLDFGLGRGIVSAGNRFLAMTTMNYQVTDDIEANLEIGYSRARLWRNGGYSFPSRVPHPILASHPANPFGVDVTFRGRPAGPAGDPLLRTVMDADNWRVVGALNGSFGDTSWNWSLDAVWSRNESLGLRQDHVDERLRLAFLGYGGPNCMLAEGTGTPGTMGCEYYNPWGSRFIASPGDVEYQDPALLQYMMEDTFNKSEARLVTYSALVTGDLFELPAGPVGTALSVEYRDEKLRNTFDAMGKAGAFGWLDPTFDFDALRDNYAISGELIIPVLENAEIQLAGRYEDYGDDIDTFDPKIGFRWGVLDNLTLRGTWGTSFRAPGLLQKNAVLSSTTGIRVPQMNPVAGTAYGNPDLQPEEAEIFSLGVEYEPIPELNLSAEYWYFDYNDISVRETAQPIYDAWAATGANPNRTVVGANGSTMTIPTITFDPGVAVADRDGMDVIAINLLFINASSMMTEGLDFGANYRRDVGNFGSLTLDAKATWVHRYTFKESATSAKIKGVGHDNGTTFGASSPRWRANFYAQLEKGNHLFRVTPRYVSGMLQDRLSNNLDTHPDMAKEDYWSVDMLYTYDFAWGSGEPWALRAGVNNVLDDLPPLVYETSSSINTQIFDPRGRYFTFGLKKRY